MTPSTIAENVRSIFSLPDITLRINELISAEEASKDVLKQIILQDPTLTAKILKFANNAYATR